MNNNKVLAIPVEENAGPFSRVSNHFGKAAGFMVVDLDKNHLKFFDTHNAREPGECAPIQALAAAGCKVILANSMGRGALVRCHAAGMLVLQSSGKTVAEALSVYRTKGCPDLPDDALCASHDHAHDHAHDHEDGHCSHPH